MSAIKPWANNRFRASQKCFQPKSQRKLQLIASAVSQCLITQSKISRHTTAEKVFP